MKAKSKNFNYQWPRIKNYKFRTEEYMESEKKEINKMDEVHKDRVMILNINM